MSLTQNQLRHFMDEGYVIVEGALTSDDLDPVIAGIEDFVDERASELHREGRIAELHENESFERRLALITRENTAIYDDIDIMNMRAEAVFRFLGNGRMLDLVESLVGPEITCSPIQHLRAKLPEGLNILPSQGNGGGNGGGNGEEGALAARIRENVAPWHQDAQVHLEDADPVFILTVWLPLCDTDEENGCLQIIPRVHHSRTVYWSEGFGIEEGRLPDGEVMSLPMRKGDVLLMHKLIPHRSIPNRSETIRWSLDLRYQQTGLPTGRSFYPNFIVRSRRHPEFVLSDYGTWNRGWEEALKVTAQRPPRKNKPTEPTPIRMYG
ncbi:MAG: phytanoyl-CoA dioxygenase family protein [Gemmatimonadetes bacterium]|nr:phytanoyl-CoA dioxygenase family protein [Gemmatimonadota bacterium]MYH18885.1 phytanoyl-CoA dioxygenase family protein [Gemmatimonadota bacterium]MYK97651.1 phytanoyl-CoA dioxygenase family protein [Gemmatimonadota bacterium]